MFAIELGIAVRIIFDVRLNTTDAKISASFGIADLTTALARNGAPEQTEIVTKLDDLLTKVKVDDDARQEFIDLLPDQLSDESKGKIFWDNALDFYRFPTDYLPTEFHEVGTPQS